MSGLSSFNLEIPSDDVLNKAYYVGYGETTFFLFAREAPGHSEFEFRELRKRD